MPLKKCVFFTWIRNRIRFGKKTWIRISIKRIRIRNTASKQCCGTGSGSSFIARSPFPYFLLPFVPVPVHNT